MTALSTLKYSRITVAVILAFSFGRAVAATCDRACLLQQAAQFNSNMLAHTIGKIPLAPTAEIRETGTFQAGHSNPRKHVKLRHNSKGDVFFSIRPRHVRKRFADREQGVSKQPRAFRQFSRRREDELKCARPDRELRGPFRIEVPPARPVSLRHATAPTARFNEHFRRRIEAYARCQGIIRI
jgi:hypothetical protein